MEIEHQADEDNSKTQSVNHTTVTICEGEDPSASIREQTNKLEESNEINNKVVNSESEVKKPLLAFKWQKSCTKIQSGLQGSAAKAFSSFDQDDYANRSKNRLSTLRDDLKVSDDESCESDITGLCTSCPYFEPVWGGIPEGIYKMDVFKSGVILKTLDLSYKSFHSIGTSTSCDVALSQDSISHFHAVLQYRKISDSEHETGIYIYDLESQHGTFLNGVKIKPRTYVIIHGGDLISFGNAQRKYILQTPKDIEEQEAQLSATELQELKEIELKEQEKLKTEQLNEKNKQNTMEHEEQKGISWGIIDVDELSRSTVISDCTDSDNEILFLENPKKALQDWFKWEGHDLEYQTEDKGYGKFSCWIDLTLDAIGSKKRIHVTVNGDKMKAIEECAFTACKFLDDYGYLKQAHNEKKSTVRDWEAVDYYDSDEDNFLDRTGMIEEKRQKRKKLDGKLKKQEIHISLMGQYTETCERITSLENVINLQKFVENKNENSNEDELDAYMNELNPSKLSKTKIKDVKLELQNLYKEKTLLSKSININTTAGEGQSSKADLKSVTE